jgi:ribose-phosphate pyrophosphokinase
MEKGAGDIYTTLVEKNMSSEHQEPLLFTLGANPSVSHEVSLLLNLPLSPDKVTHFADGETFAKPLISVTGRDCIIIHSTFNPVSARLFDLMVFVDALKNDHAASITAVMPYFGYARQDRIIEEGDPISGLLVAKMLQTAGVDEIVVMDFHSLKLLAQFPEAHVNLTAASLFAQQFRQDLEAAKILPNNVCVVSPDHGGLGRAQEFASAFEGSCFAYAKKNRPQPNKAVIEGVEGDFKGKFCLIIDDIIDTAGTLSEVAKYLLANGAKEVWVAATHGIFSGRAGELIKESGIKKVYIANTIESNQERAQILSIAPIVADYLRSKYLARK